MPRAVSMRRAGAVGRWFSAFDVSILLPGAATARCCFIHVPYAHKIVKIFVGYSAAAVIGSLTASLFRAKAGVDWAASGEGVSKTGVIADTGSNAGSLELIVLPGVSFIPSTVTPLDMGQPNTLYFLKLVGADAGDLLKKINLTILVEPIPRAAL